MLVTASWGGAEVAVEVDAECRGVAALKRYLQEALPELDVETVRLEVGGRSVDEEEVLGLSEGSVIDISATPAALAVTTLREEGCAVDFAGFCCAAVQGDLRRCRLYLDAAVVWRSRGDTPLHIAVSHGRREVLELLLDAGCDTNAKDEFGGTPLHTVMYARYAHNMEVAKLLLDAGCDKEAKNDSGQTPLHTAIRVGNMNAIKFLVEAGCDKDVKDDMGLGHTPLHIAIYGPNMQVAKLLLDTGFDKDAKDNNGSTPLHHAVYGQNMEVAKLLVEAGCDKDVKNCDGQTPLHIAAHRSNMADGRNMELAKLLVDAGCVQEAKAWTMGLL